MINDIGGMRGFGPVLSIEDAEPFHAAWEARVFGIVRALIYNRVLSADEFKHAVDRMDPAEYLRASYYERWTDALERLCVEKGLL